MPNADPESLSLVRLALASAVVIGLLALLAFGLKFLGKRVMSTAGTQRLQLVDSLMLDIRRRLVIVRCDDNEHLLLLGGDKDLVVETRLKTSETAPTFKKE